MEYKSDVSCCNLKIDIDLCSKRTFTFLGWGLDDEFSTRVNDSLSEMHIGVFYPQHCKRRYNSYSGHHLCAGETVRYI